MPYTIDDLNRTYATWEAQGHSRGKAAAILGHSPAGVQRRVAAYKVLAGDAAVEELPPEPEGRLRSLKGETFALPLVGEVTRYLFTAAQNDTRIHEPFWNNLLALSAHYNARVCVSRFAYLKCGLGASGDKATWSHTKTGGAGKSLRWDSRLEPYLLDVRALVAPGLVWCGEANIIPTAVNPLSGLDGYTGRNSAIFPHTKIALQSIATPPTDAAKFNYTTGAVTQRNYIQRKEGLKAEFHHCYAALLVEVDHTGSWWCRQINADSDGVIYDLDVKVDDGAVTEGHRVEAITWGDVHVAQLDEAVKHIQWGAGGILDTLRPRQQFVHDVLDFYSRSHHETKNPHAMYLRYAQSMGSVRNEVAGVIDFLLDAQRPDTETYVVDSNHDQHLGRWLRESEGVRDPGNFRFWLKMQTAIVAVIDANGAIPTDYLPMAVRLVMEEGRYVSSSLPVNIRFLDQDDSHIICPESGGGIECGLHGDRGPNGARGSARNLSKLGRKANIGHSHSAAIVDGVYQAGTSSKLRLAYNIGPSSWSHSCIITYPNGKRSIVTIWRGKWRAAEPISLRAAA